MIEGTEVSGIIGHKGTSKRGHGKAHRTVRATTVAIVKRYLPHKATLPAFQNHFCPQIIHRRTRTRHQGQNVNARFGSKA